jgi:thiol-disulfide isomerase/thioredoxin
MAETPSTMLPLGTLLPSFDLPDPEGKRHSDKEFKDQPLLVMFICNHCPFVKHIRETLAAVVKRYQDKGIAAVAINSNDAESYPEDRPEMMKEISDEFGFTFPYLYDETQEVAKAFRAACTPDFYLFDSNHKLVYRGQFDDSRPGQSELVSGDDLIAAMDAVLNDKEVPEDQKPSVGCNIKWKSGNAPDYFGS